MVASIAGGAGAAEHEIVLHERLRQQWTNELVTFPFEAEEGVSLNRIDALAKSPELDSYLRPLEEGLDDLPELKATADGATRLRHGNPGMVFAASDVEYGDEAWASFGGKAVAVGVYKAGELHPSRVFNQ